MVLAMLGAMFGLSLVSGGDTPSKSAAVLCIFRPCCLVLPPLGQKVFDVSVQCFDFLYVIRCVGTVHVCMCVAL